MAKQVIVRLIVEKGRQGADGRDRQTDRQRAGSHSVSRPIAEMQISTLG